MIDWLIDRQTDRKDMDMNIAMDVDVDSASGVGKCSTEIKAGVRQ